MNVCEVIIAKQRAGPVGDVKLQFIKKFAKFGNLEDSQLEQSLASQGYGGAPNTITMPSKFNEDGGGASAPTGGDFFPF